MVTIIGAKPWREQFEHWRLTRGLDAETGEWIWRQATQQVQDYQDGQTPPPVVILVHLTVLALTVAASQGDIRLAQRMFREDFPALYEIAQRFTTQAVETEEAIIARGSHLVPVED